ncbi:MAG: M43 family zinc metalloprotease [Chitinophagales bacterium]
MKKILGAVIFTAGMLSAVAQNWCGANTITDRYRANNPAMEAAFQAHQNQLKNMQQQEDASRGLPSDVIYIPVVYHVIHNGDAIGTGENISDAQLKSQIDVMNIHFAFLNFDTGTIPAPFRAITGDAKIQFCLAQFDPNGNPTTGINRYNLNNPDWDDNMMEAVVKPATRWDYRKYLNIWVIRPGDTMSSEGTLAYTTPSFWGWGSLDGIVSRYNCIGTTGALQAGYTLGKTITHEVGHWLGLNHTWGPNNGGSATCSDDDGISDTPKQFDLTGSCATFPLTDQCTTTSPGIMFMNYMDYPPDACRTMFSNGQIARMRSVIDQNRAQIKTSIGKCFVNLDAAMLNILHPTDSICSLNFTPLIEFKNNGQTDITNLTFNINLDGVSQTTSWNGLLEPFQSLQLPLVSLNTTAGSHNLTISISGVNNAGADNQTANDAQTIIFTSYDGGTGSGIPYSENFESGIFPPADYSIINPNNDYTWADNGDAGGFGTTTNSVFINHASSTTNSRGRKDDMVTPAFDFANTNNNTFAFDLAYSKRGSNTDSLAVYYSTDCGVSWVLLWKDGGVHMSTSSKGDTMKPFIPDANEWIRKSFDVSYLSQQRSVTFMFRSISGWGNAMYVDNINITADPLGISPYKDEVLLQIQPNPANNMISVRTGAESAIQTLRVVDLTGRVLISQPVVDALSIVYVDQLPNGIYCLEAVGKTNRKTIKFSIAR